MKVKVPESSTEPCLSSPHFMLSEMTLPVCLTSMVLHWPAPSACIFDSDLTGSLASSAVMQSVVTSVLAGLPFSTPVSVACQVPSSSSIAANATGASSSPTSNSGAAKAARETPLIIICKFSRPVASGYRHPRVAIARPTVLGYARIDRLSADGWHVRHAEDPRPNRRPRLSRRRGPKPLSRLLRAGDGDRHHLQRLLLRGAAVARRRAVRRQHRRLSVAHRSDAHPRPAPRPRAVGRPHQSKAGLLLLHYRRGDRRVRHRRQFARLRHAGAGAVAVRARPVVLPDLSEL